MTPPNEDSPRTPATHLWVVDQIDGGHAAVEVDGERVMTVPLWMLPDPVREGDVLRVQHDRHAGRSVLTVVTDDEERQRRLARSEKQTSVRSKNDRPGDVTL